MKKRKGQGILEYVIVLTTIVAIVIIAATAIMQPKTEAVYDEAASIIDNAAIGFGKGGINVP